VNYTIEAHKFGGGGGGGGDVEWVNSLSTTARYFV